MKELKTKIEILNKQLLAIQAECLTLNQHLMNEEELFRKHHDKENIDLMTDLTVLCYNEKDQLIGQGSFPDFDEATLNQDWDDFRLQARPFDTCYLLHDIEDHHHWLSRNIEPTEISHVEIQLTIIRQKFIPLKISDYNFPRPKVVATEDVFMEITKAILEAENWIKDQPTLPNPSELIAALKEYVTGSDSVYCNINLMQESYAYKYDKSDIYMDLGTYALNDFRENIQRKTLTCCFPETIHGYLHKIFLRKLYKDCFFHKLACCDSVWAEITNQWRRRIDINY